MVLNLCEMFHCTPSVLEEESADIIRLLNIREMGTRKEESKE